MEQTLLKILFDSTELSYYLENSGHRAGVFYVALNLFRELKKRDDIQLTFVCNFKRYYFMKNLIETVPEFQGVTLLKEQSVINKFWGMLNYLARNCSRKIVYGVLSISRYYENLFYIQNKNNKKQIEAFDVYFSPFTPPCKEGMNSNKIKRFMMIHDIIPILENNGHLPQNPRLWDYRLYHSINKNDYYFTNSENTRNDIIKYFKIDKSHIKTTLLAANNNFYPAAENSPIEGKYIFSLCTLGKRKNLEFGIRNFFRFIEKNKIDDLKLVLGGSVWKKYERELYNTLKNYDKSKIILTGYIEEKELAKYYSNALCFIYPSLYEGFGLPVLEAMQCGCPVITSNVSSLPEVIGDAGIQVNPKSDEEMIEAYEKMYFDNDFRQKCCNKGLERAKQFSWEKCASELLEFMKTNCI